MLEISIPGHEVLHLVGEGGMAQVFAGARLGAGQSIKPVAIKRIRPEYAANRRFREMFLSEGRTTMMFSHSNIVTVFDVWDVGDDLYIVMDWVDGVTLDQFARTLVSKRGRPLDLAVVLAVVTRLLCALHYAHNFRINRKKVGIVHRDITPYNVMITSSGEVKLMDFGVARIADGRTTPSLKGNLVYMPREQAQGNPRVESDLFAVGGLLFGLLEGRRFRDHCTTEDELLSEIWNASAVPELQRTDVPEGLRRLLRELLAPNWRDRPHSAAEVIKRIEALPVEQHSSLLPMQELYRAFFGESHSGLTRFAHRDPEMWVDHMRKLGLAAAGRQLVREPAVVAAAEASPTKLQPRAHETVALHPVSSTSGAPLVDFDERRTLPFGRAIVDADDPRISADAKHDGDRQSSGAGAEPTAGPPPQDDAARDEASLEELPTTAARRAPRPSADAAAAGQAAPALALPLGLFSRWGWVSRTLGGSRLRGLARWRSLATGPLGVIVATTVGLGVVLPLACHTGGERPSEVGR